MSEYISGYQCLIWLGTNNFISLKFPQSHNQCFNVLIHTLLCIWLISIRTNNSKHVMFWVMLMIFQSLQFPGKWLNLHSGVYAHFLSIKRYSWGCCGCMKGHRHSRVFLCAGPYGLLYETSLIWFKQDVFYGFSGVLWLLCLKTRQIALAVAKVS